MNKKPITIRPLKKEEETTLKSRLDKVEEIMRENDLFNLAVKYALLEEENQQLKSVLNEVREIINYYGITPEENDNSTLRHTLRDISKILDKVGDK